jgi:hypothetical protein
MEETNMSDLQTETRAVEPFTEISLGGVGDLVIEMGEKESVTVQARPDVLPHIVSRVDGARLALRLEWRGLDAVFRSVGPINYHVTARRLEGVHVSGAASVTGSGLSGDAFDLGISGAGKARVQAEAELDARISGTGQVLYAGRPIIRKRVSGVGRVSPIAED